MEPLRDVVCATDFSENSRDAMLAACRLGLALNGCLHLVHVVVDPFDQAWTVEAAGIDFAELRQRLVTTAEMELAEAAERLPLPREQIRCVVLVGKPAAAIARYAEEKAADLVVLGTHGYGIVKRFLLGSVAEQMVRRARCPVLVVPHHVLRSDSSTGTPAAQVARD